MGLNMQIKISKKAIKNLDNIFTHTKVNFTEALAVQVLNSIAQSLSQLSEFPQLGSAIQKNALKRKLIVSGNIIYYEIILSKLPYIVVRNVVPRKTSP